MNALWIFIGAVLFVFLLILLRISREQDILSNNQTITQPPQAEFYEDLLLPDLRVTPPQQLYVEVIQGVKKVRFSTTFINQGKGPLELINRHNTQNNKFDAIQKIVKIDGNTEETVVGEFIFHKEHNHWHIKDYVLFQLWSLKENNKKDKLTTTTSKMSFCIWDERVYDLTLENASKTQKYMGCPSDIQGISVGWSDNYEATTEGQELDINSVPDGKYIISTIINPDMKILESNYLNNEATLFIEIKGSNISVSDMDSSL